MFLRLTLLVVLAIIVTGSRRYDPCRNYYCSNGETCVTRQKYGVYRYSKLVPKCECSGHWKGERCDDNPCTGHNCSNGTCLVSQNGTGTCCCPNGCKGDSCDIQDDTVCIAAGGRCVLSNKCNAGTELDVPCCNGNVCCKTTPTCITKNGLCFGEKRGLCVENTSCVEGIKDVTGLQCCNGLTCCM